MLITSPTVVRFGTLVWEDVALIAVDRQADRTVIDHDDLGPHAVFADAPEQSTRIRIIRNLARDDIDTPIPADTDDLVFYTSPSGSDAARKRITAATAVVLSIKHDLTPSTTHQTITLIATSPTGATDPLAIEDAN